MLGGEWDASRSRMPQITSGTMHCKTVKEPHVNPTSTHNPNRPTARSASTPPTRRWAQRPLTRRRRSSEGRGRRAGRRQHHRRHRQLAAHLPDRAARPARRAVGGGQRLSHGRVRQPAAGPSRQLPGLPAPAPARLRRGQGSSSPCPACSADAEAACREYEALLRAHPADLCALGIGENGHLAFNDPPYADFDDPVWVKSSSWTSARGASRWARAISAVWTRCRRTPSP